MHFRTRPYDPRTGRFLGKDPILGRKALSHYTYANNNPVMLKDPMGTIPERELEFYVRYMSQLALWIDEGAATNSENLNINIDKFIGVQELVQLELARDAALAEGSDVSVIDGQLTSLRQHLSEGLGATIIGHGYMEIGAAFAKQFPGQQLHDLGRKILGPTYDELGSGSDPALNSQAARSLKDVAQGRGFVSVFKSFEGVGEALAWQYITLPVEVMLQVLGARAGIASFLGEGAKGADLVAKGSVWLKQPFKRGSIIENIIGLRRNLHRTFPVVDRFDKGVVTSIKSLDTLANTYRNERALERVLMRYVDQVARFKGASLGRQSIGAGNITGRVLHVVSPTGVKSGVWTRVQRYATSKGVKLVNEVLEK